MVPKLSDFGVSQIPINTFMTRLLYQPKVLNSKRGELIFPRVVTGIGSTCTKSSNTTTLPDYEATIGQYETSVLDALDNVLFQLHTAGIKAIISPHDANLLPPNGTTVGYNGIDIYGAYEAV